MKLIFDQTRSYMGETEYIATKKINEQTLNIKLPKHFSYNIFKVDESWFAKATDEYGARSLGFWGTLEEAKKVCEGDFDIFLKFYRDKKEREERRQYDPIQWLKDYFMNVFLAVFFPNRIKSDY